MMSSVTLLIVSCILIQPCISAELKFKPQSQGGESADENAKGVNWALIVAGSNGYDNYRHQVFCAHKLAILEESLTRIYQDSLGSIHEDTVMDGHR